jgi:hypothetical protein
MYTPLHYLVMEVFAKPSVSEESVRYHIQRLVNCLGLKLMVVFKLFVSFCEDVSMGIFFLKFYDRVWCEFSSYKKGNLYHVTC